MNTIGNVQANNSAYSNQETKVTSNTAKSTTTTENLSSDSFNAVLYEESDSNAKVATYTPDMDKVRAMQEETDNRLIDLLSKTISGSTLKQLGGIRGFIAKFQSGEIKAEDVDFEITDEAVAKAQEETAVDGYWGAEQTSDRFLEFAQALSGSDPSKADMLLDAVKEGYKMAEDIWGSELPQLSQDTLEMTIKKFEAWRDSTDYDPSQSITTDETTDTILGQALAAQDDVTD